MRVSSTPSLLLCTALAVAVAVAQASPQPTPGTQHFCVKFRLDGTHATKRLASDADHRIDLTPLKPEIHSFSSRSELTGCPGGTVLYGAYAPTLNVTGWNTLNVSTSSSGGSDKMQAFAAGYAEGYHTAADWAQWYSNQFEDANPLNGPISPAAAAYINSNWAWMASQAKALRSADPYWYHVWLVMAQIQGMFLGLTKAGVKLAGGRAVALIDVLMLTILPDLEDLSVVFPLSEEAKRPNMRDVRRAMAREMYRKKDGTGKNILPVRGLHCSSLVVVSPTLDNLYFGQTTWQAFAFQLRIYKTFTFDFAGVALGAATVQFSSYPGALASFDDFYATSAQLIVMETSLEVWNQTMYDVLTYKSVFTPHRAVVSNRISTSGAEWAATFSLWNSGTYNNDWIIVNIGLFTPNTSIVNGTLWVLEQLPGVIEAQDMSGLLYYSGMYASYNVPVFPKIYKLSDSASQDPNWFNYEQCFRSKIFRNIAQPGPTSVSAMQYIMQYNNYLGDPFENLDPNWAISARGDLPFPRQPNRMAMAFGGIDQKMSDYNSYVASGKGTVYAFAGPTPQQPVFSWAGFSGVSATHVGLPAFWNFTYQQFDTVQP